MTHFPWLRRLSLPVLLVAGSLSAPLLAQTSATQPDSSAPAAAPNAPAPPGQSAAASAATPSIAEQAQQMQLQSIGPLRPFHVELPHSHNPLSPYRPSFVPPVDLHNSPRLENLIRDGKLYLSLQDAIALAIENNLDLASFRYNLPTALT
ncbi:MAG TPA: hypothetical protein VL990_14120, partial [Acidobacteriaceae bacterium]|nr:hypothetical protein [Acidobacteriaceae bacterium]